MALAFVNRQRFVTSTLIGATTMAQLETNLASIDVRLSDDVIQAIEVSSPAHSHPCPEPERHLKTT
jgi:aryl-alcohol dehydrogenase-like predicted oxidoreductase